jgi:predicted RNA-binding protein with EMAP domain
MRGGATRITDKVRGNGRWKERIIEAAGEVEFIVHLFHAVTQLI